MWEVVMNGRHGKQAEAAGNFTLSELVSAYDRQKWCKTIIVSKVELFKQRENKKIMKM